MATPRQTLLRERYTLGTGSNLVFTWVMVGVMVALFWGHSSTTGLIVWGALMCAVNPVVGLIRQSTLEFSQWYRAEIAAQFMAGVSWSIVAIIAMPTDDVHSALLAAILSAVAIASSSGEGQFQLLYMSFLTPFVAITGFGYFVSPGGLRSGGGLFLIAVVFAAVTASQDRALHLRLVDTTLENQELIQQLGNERDALQSANDKLDQLSLLDPLTGLANRIALTRRLDELRRPNDSTISLAFLDLNRFKQVNDHHGHLTGDQLLQAIAQRLRSVCVDGELACRHGGDELMVLSETNDLHNLGERLASVFDEDFRLDESVLPASAAIGVAAALSTDSLETLLHRADEALYSHKRNGRANRFEIWDPKLGDQAA